MENDIQTPPRSKRGADLPVGRRYAMAVEIALFIPSGKILMPRGVSGPMAEQYGVGSEYPRQHWAASAKLRSRKPGSSASQTNVVIHKENRSFAVGHVSDQLKEIGLECGSSTVARWFDEEGVQKVARRIKPSLSEAQKKRRIDFICDQVDETAGDYLNMANVIHLDESWLLRVS
eukprot:jgi/Undpi1/2767/HiC_scaffold_14.g06144.m1